MSDRMSNVEIEDVISSIRKLVTEDEPGEAPAEGGDRLVLGQSQLVEKSAETEAKGPLKLGKAITPAKAKDPEPDAALPPEVEVPKSQPEVSSGALEEELAELEAKVFDKGDAAADDEAEAETAVEEYDPVIDGKAEEVHDWEPAEGVPGHSFGQAEPEVEDADLAEVPEPAPPKAEVLMFSKAARSKARTEEPKAEAPAPAAEAQGEPAADATEEQPAKGKTKSAKTSKVKTDMEEVEPEVADPKVEAATPSPASAEADLVPVAAEEQLPAETKATDLETMLDEDELRTLVSAVIREELKGVLGERITRNVRKMVRREIANALSGLDID